MNFISSVHSEFSKVKHTSFFLIHTLLPILGAAIFIFIFKVYNNYDNIHRLKEILEITAVVFPIVISVVTSLNVNLENKTAHFQSILLTKSRTKIFLAKLIMLFVSGVLSLVTMFLLFWTGCKIFGNSNSINLNLLSESILGIILGIFILYLWHIILGLKFGMGISLFLGVFESLQVILFSNLDLMGAARYIPFAWPVDWVHDVLNDRLIIHQQEWIIILIINVIAIIFSIIWFKHWEGKKSVE